jgi:hypothetical protein
MRKTLALCLLASALTHGAPARAEGHAACTDASSQGQIQRDAHKLLEARAQFFLCARQECPGVVRRDCSAWLEQVQASIPTVVPIATDEAGNGLVGARVSMDGKVLLERIDGQAVDVNPGTHTFTFEAADGTKADIQMVIAEGQKDKRITATIAKAPVSPGPVAPPGPALSSLPESPPPEPPSSAPWKTIGLVTAGVGVVGLGLGTVFGLEASSKKSSAGCDANSQCPTQAGVSTLSTAQSDGNLSTVFFIAGGVLAAGGLLVWALAPSSRVQVAPTVGTNAAGLLLRGAW